MSKTTLPVPGDREGGGGVSEEESSVPEILTAEEAADLLRVSTKTLRRLHIPYARVGKRRRYLREDILGYIKDKVA